MLISLCGGWLLCVGAFYWPGLWNFGKVSFLKGYHFLLSILNCFHFKHPYISYSNISIFLGRPSIWMENYRRKAYKFDSWCLDYFLILRPILSLSHVFRSLRCVLWVNIATNHFMNSGEGKGELGSCLPGIQKKAGNCWE